VSFALLGARLRAMETIVAKVSNLLSRRGKSAPRLTCFGFVNEILKTIGGRYRISEKMQFQLLVCLQSVPDS
jgi:hypothetical protein